MNKKFDYLKLAENLYENYKEARLKILEQVKGKIKLSDRYFWNQLTKNERSVWVTTATMISIDYVINEKNQTTEGNT